MTSLKTECRKFAPNIFNKIKCQNCFRGKDAHSTEALESNRATRKVSCCGYLFVAPDWDFSLPANRNKRWQRRWFVLYDDGELAYSVDEHPETVPQAVIDMNRVLEVADAENVTGNPFALAVTCPEKVHFIKGTSKDESKKWFEVLSKFPRNTVCGKYKRNATFPCIKSTPVLKIETPPSTLSSSRRDTVDMTNYSKHNGYVSSLNRGNLKQSAGVAFDPDDDVYPTKDTNSVVKTPLKTMEDKKKQDISTSISDENNCLRNALPESMCVKPDNAKIYLKQDAREARKLHSRSDITKMIPSSEDKFVLRPSSSSSEFKSSSSEFKSPSSECGGKSFHNPVYLLMSDVPPGKKLDSYENFFVREKPRCLRRQSSFGKKSDLQKQMLAWSEGEVEAKERTIHKSASVPNAVLREDSKVFLLNGKDKCSVVDTVDKAQLKSSLSQIRGDPDGCNLDSLPSYCTSTAEFTTDQSSEQSSSSLKKGWLVKQEEEGGRWSKWWFVLRNSALAYFGDPIAEDAGVMDGFVDLRRVKGVQEVEGTSGFTFCVVMKDFSKLYLSAVTSKIRNNWIRAILQAANLKSPDDTPKRKEEPPSAVGGRTSKTLGEDEERGGNPLALPPSPPLARTAISRVKERAKTRSNSRTRSPKFAESDPSYPVDSDDGTTDHSSSSLLNNNVGTPVKERKSFPKENTPKSSEDKPSGSKPERRRSFRLESVADGRKKATDIKDKLEDSSWTIWLDISKFCKEVESKLDELEEKSPRNGSGEQKRELGTLVSSLGRVEDRLHRVHGELEKAKATLLLRDGSEGLGLGSGKVFGCHSLKREVSRLSGISSQNALLAQQLNGAREENRRLKAEAKRAQDASDDFELACVSLRRAGEQAERLHASHMGLMVARVDDLTSKLFASEKCVRQLRQRVSKLEQRQERRRSSLKGKEGLTLSKEYEAKLAELEQKIGAVERKMELGTGVEGEAKGDSQSLLARLHNLDRKVKDVAETVASEEARDPLPPKPKIRLQVNLNEDVPQEEAGEDWNSLSLSASMTDLTTADGDDACGEEDPLSLSFADCLESLGHKVSSLVAWLKTSLQLLYAQGHMNPFQSSKIDFIGGEAGEELSKLVRTLEFVTGKMEEPLPGPQGLSRVVSKLLYNIILLQEVTNIVFKMSDFEKYKAAILAQHLHRVGQAIAGMQQYIEQKSSPVHSGVQKISLCNVVACLLFHKSPLEEEVGICDVNVLFEEVDGKRRHISSVLAEFKEKFIERFCATILELSEESVCDRAGPLQKDPKVDPKPLGQKQFLSHISHIISQVSQSFISHISRSLNEAYFLCSSLQYGEKWTEYVCKLLRQELGLLSSEIKSICVKHLENNFFSSSKCGVLVEYMHCSISELAQIVSIVTVVDGTVVLIKDALYGEDKLQGCHLSLKCEDRALKDALTAFHESLQLRTAGALANLPPLRLGRESSLGLCDPNAPGVAHRSVSSLLCFKRKWRQAAEAERRGHQAQLEEMGKRLEEMRLGKEGECRGCFELRQDVSYLQGELEESRAVARTGSMCEKCRGMRAELQRLEEGREAKWNEHLQEVVREKDKQFEKEKEKLEQELHMAQSNIKRLERHYDEEIRGLQRLYEQKLQQRNEHVRDDIKLRYSDEIEQLKSLCERGLCAMDASHQKIVSELERRHQLELEDIMVDKERALEEEAHATAIALEAVRKAHSEELQKQIQKFKDDFVLKMNKRFETEAFKKCYESDLSNVKCEILTMTEKYSVKCLENATLQEKLEIMNQQLKSTTTQVVELLAKNQQLQARLTSDTLQKQEESII